MLVIPCYEVGRRARSRGRHQILDRCTVGTSIPHVTTPLEPPSVQLLLALTRYTGRDRREDSVGVSISPCAIQVGPWKIHGLQLLVSLDQLLDNLWAQSTIVAHLLVVLQLVHLQSLGEILRHLLIVRNFTLESILLIERIDLHLLLHLLLLLRCTIEILLWKAGVRRATTRPWALVLLCCLLQHCQLQESLRYVLWELFLSDGRYNLLIYHLLWLLWQVWNLLLLLEMINLRYEQLFKRHRSGLCLWKASCWSHAVLILVVEHNWVLGKSHLWWLDLRWCISTTHALSKSFLALGKWFLTTLYVLELLLHNLDHFSHAAEHAQTCWLVSLDIHLHLLLVCSEHLAAKCIDGSESLLKLLLLVCFGVRLCLQVVVCEAQ